MATTSDRPRRRPWPLLRTAAILVGYGLCIGQAAAKTSAADDCTFDRQAQRQRMREAAARQGGRLDADANTATWRRPDGDTVSVAYGGCADLGTSVTLRYGMQRRAPSASEAIERLLAAVARYWSPAEAAYVGKAIRAARDQAGQDQIAHDEAGTVVIVGPLEPGPGFSFGFELRLTPEQATLSWQGG